MILIDTKTKSRKGRGKEGRKKGKKARRKAEREGNPKPNQFFKNSTN